MEKTINAKETWRILIGSNYDTATRRGHARGENEESYANKVSELFLLFSFKTGSCVKLEY